MVSNLILNELCQKLNCNEEDLIIEERNISLPSHFEFSSIVKWNDKAAILKQDTNQREWLFYSQISQHYDVPVPEVYAYSDDKEVKWVLFKKIVKGIHPKKYEKKHIERAVQALAKLHSTFIEKHTDQLFKTIPKPYLKPWEEEKGILLANLEQGIRKAQNFYQSTPLDKEVFEQAKEDILSENFLEDLLACGNTLLHGDTWTYNFMQPKDEIYLLDWEQYFFGPSAYELIYFYDLLSLVVDGMKVELRDVPYEFEDIANMYINECKIHGWEIDRQAFSKSLKRAVSLQMAYHWATTVKPHSIYLKGGLHFVRRMLRLMPSLEETRTHLDKILKIREIKL